ncbi:hypothetical protein R1sor_009601 [Riccia sorocarpa]|uniref:Uncharacterized protein n=1 Tax=Riccia sorocarpa TaxID=122646 RepID=A0ABD3HZK0_9MARC
MSRRALATRLCRSVIREVEKISLNKISYDDLAFRRLIELRQELGESKTSNRILFRNSGAQAVAFSSEAHANRVQAASDGILPSYGGTVQLRETVEENSKVARHGTEAASRELVVTFNADVADSMPWKFTPCQHQTRTELNTTRWYFTLPKTPVSTYNVIPKQAGVYFNKIQCFCFEEQRLRASEKIDMPLRRDEEEEENAASG